MDAQLFDISYLNLFTGLFVVVLLAGMLVRFWLAGRQMRHVAWRREHVPEAFAGVISQAAHQKAAAYTIAKNQFDLWSSVYSAAILIGWTLLGGLGLLNYTLLERIEHPMWQQLSLLAVFFLINGLLELPLGWFQTFRLEERFGFNKSTIGLWLGDIVKGTVMAAVIGLPLAALFLWLMQEAGSLWWLWAWAIWVVFNLLLMVIFPTFIAPLFNKFKPLEDGELAQRVQQLMQRCGFNAKGLFVMDGSKRSAHANAYFTGLGHSKRVVFFDTLLARLQPDEVEAVLAHELGHFHFRHIAKRLIAMFALSLAAFALLGWLYNQVWFYTGLGVVPNMMSPNAALALILFMLVTPVFGYFLSPLMAQLSRKHEFEADAYAVRQTGNKALPDALLKLYEDNASTLTPDPLYVKWYYSHPPASERLARMAQAA
ncbi:M48 family metallopeptidase [Brachymonas denitrificans]|jgi:STE24 endopeptidase|uniref:STE24 endopeptidase n=1 Tax=Brachymonas denitrificans DSM 15123 TaxID=1121117 RepID=A0A1H8HYK6_9BURK|nr:M48 family metallopeptidase [Brachymonas denitrificans]SEN61151.1 STE24 endopeptidase [Brachymonas denitrificans DSM 15123]